MSREWKPGDVALVTSWRGADQIGLRVRPRVVEDPLTWCALDESGDSRGLSDDEVIAARPLVVIDPEDGAQIDWLIDVVWRAGGNDFRGESPASQLNIIGTWQAALREFLDPTPPKPAEPTGLGAVVEDAEGVLWIRVSERFRACTGAHKGRYCRYTGSDPTDSIDAVRVLSEGVTP